MPRYEWPEDKVLAAAVERHGLRWLADELGVPPTTLYGHLARRRLPTRAAAHKLETSAALQKVADLVA